MELSNNQNQSEKSLSDILREYGEKGFIFHGRPEGDLKIIVPASPKYSERDDEFSRDRAVYASDNPASSIMFSLINRKDSRFAEGTWNASWSEKGDGFRAKVPVSWKSALEKNSGFVYVCSKDGFITHGEGTRNKEYKSHKNVIPIDMVSVTLRDFYNLGGKVEWTK